MKVIVVGWSSWYWHWNDSIIWGKKVKMMISDRFKVMKKGNFEKYHHENLLLNSERIEMDFVR